MNEIINPGVHISKLTFNNGETLELNDNDIVVFVGPNNVGKSKALKDIYELSNNKNNNTILIKEIELKKRGEENLKGFLEKRSIVSNQGNLIYYNGYGYSLHSQHINNFIRMDDLGDFRGLFISYMNTENRLTIVNPPASITPESRREHPIQVINFDDKYRKMVSKHFEKAFGQNVIPHPLHGHDIPLCIGPEINDIATLVAGGNATDQIEKYGQILNGYQKLNEQGDGMRSFGGVLLSLILDNYSIHLIDEPESFLHPPQANIMGRMISELILTESQAFISTHSEEIVKGLLEYNSSRVKIIRITREGNINSFTSLKNEEIKNLWQDPILKYSNILTSLFSKRVVLCESDSDCKFYSTILTHVKFKKGTYNDVLFIHCSGKNRMWKIVNALRLVGVNISVIVDIDIFEFESDIKKLIESYNQSWEEYKADYAKLLSSVNNKDWKIDREKIKEEINNQINLYSDKYISSQEVFNIRKILRMSSNWGVIKKRGKEAIPTEDGKNSFNLMLEKLNSVGIFVVKVGEPENFFEIQDYYGPSHGPTWVAKLFETYTNLDDDIYIKAREFIESLML